MKNKKISYDQFVVDYTQFLADVVLPTGKLSAADMAEVTTELLEFFHNLIENNIEMLVKPSVWIDDAPVGNLADLADEDGVLSFTHEQKQALTNEVTGAFNKVGVECPHCIGMHLSGMAEMLLSTPTDDGVSDGHDVHWYEYNAHKKGPHKLSRRRAPFQNQNNNRSITTSTWTS